MTKIELKLNDIIYLAYPCEKCKIGYEKLNYISKEEIKKSKTFKTKNTAEGGFLEEDIIIFNENNLGFVITEKEINKKHKTYLSTKGIERTKRLLKDILLDEIANIQSEKTEEIVESYPQKNMQILKDMKRKEMSNSLKIDNDKITF